MSYLMALNKLLAFWMRMATWLDNQSVSSQIFNEHCYVTYIVLDAGDVAMNIKDQIFDLKNIPTGGRKKTMDI